MENPPPAEPNGAYTLDLKTGNGQLFVGSNPTPSAKPAKYWSIFACRYEA